MKNEASCRWAALLAGLAVAGSAQAQGPKPPAFWQKEPTDAQVRQAAPPATPEGRAIFRCHMGSQGGLSDCRTISETPSGSGFAQAMASLTPLFRADPARVATDVPDGIYTLSIDTFQWDKPVDWLRKPSQQDLIAVWPREAWAKGQAGHAVINCLVNTRGVLYDCVATHETPRGQAFGAAAVALTPQFLMKPATKGGQPIISAVNIPINFGWPRNAGPPPKGGPDHLNAPAAMGWIEAPSFADVARIYPRKAREEHAAGRATVQCVINSVGRLTTCRVLLEEPKGMGFGAAAGALADRFRAPTVLGGDSLNHATVQLPFTFDPAFLEPTQPSIGKPQWAALASAEQTAAAFRAVTEAGVSGTVRVMMNCAVQPDGGMADCKVVREEPAGKGVAEAALSLAPHFKVTTWTNEGLPTVGGRLNIPLRYEGGTDPAQPAKP